MQRTRQPERIVARSLAGIGVAALLAIAQPAAADELIANGGFETGDFSDWVTLANFEFSDVQCPGMPITFEGDCYARFGPVGSVGTIAQQIGTEVGTSYTISFAFESDGAIPNAFTVSFGGVPLFSASDISDTGGFVTETFSTLASDTASTLSFDFRNDSGYLYLDAVSVTPAATVPEPGSIGLVLAALGVLALQRRR